VLEIVKEDHNYYNNVCPEERKILYEIENIIEEPLCPINLGFFGDYTFINQDSYLIMLEF